jgi:hypothetical protein
MRRRMHIAVVGFPATTADQSAKSELLLACTTFSTMIYGDAQQG